MQSISTLCAKEGDDESTDSGGQKPDQVSTKFYSGQYTCRLYKDIKENTLRYTF